MIPGQRQEIRDMILGCAAVSHYADPVDIAERVNIAPSDVVELLFGEVISEPDPAEVSRWVLKPSVRRRLLATGAKAVQHWTSLGVSELETETDRVLRSWLVGTLVLADRIEGDFEILTRVAGWLSDATWVEPRIDTVVKALACEELHRRLEYSASSTFVGRVDDLSWISASLDASPHGVVIEANGGIGKSALLAKLLLDRKAFKPDGWIAFMIDFDDPGLTVTQLDALFAEIARQLVVQLPEMADVEVLFGQSRVTNDSEKNARGLEDSWIFSLVSYMFDRIGNTNRPTVLVFDTLERVIHRAPELVGGMFQMLRELGATRPWISFVISGRGPIDLPELADLPHRSLGPLDPVSAKALLDQLDARSDSPNPVGSRRILARLPESQLTPLTLRLASRCVHDLGSDVIDDAILDEAIRKAFLVGEQTHDLTADDCRRPK